MRGFAGLILFVTSCSSMADADWVHGRQGEVAFQIAQHPACDFRTDQRMLGRKRPASLRFEHSRRGLAGIVK